MTHRWLALLLAALPALAAAQGPLGGVPAGMKCYGDRIVWLNTETHVYHFAGNSNFGTTPQGLFTCEHDAVAEGARPGISDQQGVSGW
jgi:hypothetical protein